MPELPEVETIVEELRGAVVGRRIVAVTVRERRLRRLVAPDLGTTITSRCITGVQRRGKFVLVALDGGCLELVAHLGMSGTLALRTAEAPARTHDHVVIALDDGRRLVLNDPRRFGLLSVQPVDRFPTRLGLEPLGESFTGAALAALARRRRRPIKNLLMDQSLIAGLGNIYANEILATAGVRPGRAAGRLRRREHDAVVAATRTVLQEAIGRRGSSISDFRDLGGNPGGFQDRFLVYDRAGQPCRRCRTSIRQRVMAGRSTFYCPKCQR
jgi:formamidopyrimidine-DNA glycosylase